MTSSKKKAKKPPPRIAARGPVRAKKPAPKRGQRAKAPDDDQADDDHIVDKLVEEIRQPLLDLAEERRRINGPLDGRERALFGRVAQDLYNDDEDYYYSHDPRKNASLVEVSNRLWQAGLSYKPWTVRRRLVAYFTEKRLAGAGVAPVQELGWTNSVLVELERLRAHPQAQIEVATTAAKKGFSKGRTKDAVDAKLVALAPDPGDESSKSATTAKVRWTAAVVDDVVEDVVQYLRRQLVGAPPKAIKRAVAGLRNHLRELGGTR